MKKEITPAENIINNVCKIKKNESVLIIANPATDFIAQELYTAANQAGAKTSLIYQNSKTSFDNAEKTVLASSLLQNASIEYKSLFFRIKKR